MTQTEANTEEIEHLKAALKKAEARPIVTVYLIAVLIIFTLTIGAGSVLLSVSLARRSEMASERKLCAVVITSDDTYRAQPPTTATGRVQAANFARLRLELGCPAPQENQ